MDFVASWNACLRCLNGFGAKPTANPGLQPPDLLLPTVCPHTHNGSYGGECAESTQKLFSLIRYNFFESKNGVSHL